MTSVLQQICGHPDFAPHINYSLHGNTFIDHVIGLVENTLEQKPADKSLLELYQGLRPEYPIYFEKSRPASEPKPPRYKACNGF